MGKSVASDFIKSEIKGDENDLAEIPDSAEQADISNVIPQEEIKSVASDFIKSEIEGDENDLAEIPDSGEQADISDVIISQEEIDTIDINRAAENESIEYLVEYVIVEPDISLTQYTTVKPDTFIIDFEELFRTIDLATNECNNATVNLLGLNFECSNIYSYGMSLKDSQNDENQIVFSFEHVDDFVGIALTDAVFRWRYRGGHDGDGHKEEYENEWVLNVKALL